MISQRIISRLAGRQADLFDQSGPRSYRTFAALSSLSKSPELPQQSHSPTLKSHYAFGDVPENSKAQTRLLNSVVPSSLGNSGLKLQFSQAKPFFGAMTFTRFLHSAAPNEFEKETDTRPTEMQSEGRPYETNVNAGPTAMFRNIQSIELERNPRSFRPSERIWNRPERNTGPFEMQRDSGTRDTDSNARPMEMFRSFRRSEMVQNTRNTGFTERNTRLFDRNGRPSESGFRSLETGRDTRSMNIARGILENNGSDTFGGNRFSRRTIEQNADIVHIKLMKNNAYVTVTDSEGNKKLGASGGLLASMKGGPKVSRYSAEATAEHVGRLAKDMGLKSVVVKVNGFTFFKKKKQAVLSFRDGYTHSRSDQPNPIVYIEDTTRLAHNGCRLRKKRRV